MRIPIQERKWIRIHADPDPQPWFWLGMHRISGYFKSRMPEICYDLIPVPEIFSLLNANNVVIQMVPICISVRRKFLATENFFDRSEQVNKPKVRNYFRSPKPNFWRAHTRQSFHSRWPKYYFFFVKIGMKFPFTLKNKPRNTNLKFYFYTVPVPFLTPKKVGIVTAKPFPD